MRAYFPLSLVLLLVASCDGPCHVSAANNADHAADKAAAVDRAVCVLVPISGSGVSGVVTFTRHGDMIDVSGKISGLKPGKHGFHVHQFGDPTDVKEGKSAGGHFNPENKPHGKPGDKERHVGDLGNIDAGADGVATIDIKDSVLQLGGPHSIVGRSLVVHADADKFTQPVGDAGGRVAFGVIGIAEAKK